MSPVPITIWEEPAPRSVAVSARHAWLTGSSGDYGITSSSSAAEAFLVDSTDYGVGIQIGDSTTARLIVTRGVNAVALKYATTPADLAALASPFTALTTEYALRNDR